MKIKNNKPFNMGYKGRKPKQFDKAVARINLVAGSTTELDDEFWTSHFADICKRDIENGYLTVVEDVKLTPAAVEKKEVDELKAAKALIKAAEKKATEAKAAEKKAKEKKG